MADIQYDKFPQVAVYGDKCAMQVKAQDTRAGFKTVALDFALSQKGDGNSKQYAWKQGISLQLTDQELPVFTAVVFGYLNFASWSRRGNDASKSLRIEHQGTNLYIQAGQETDRYALPVNAPDSFHMGSFLINRLQANHPGLSVSDTLEVLRMTTAPMAAARLEQYRKQKG